MAAKKEMALDEPPTDGVSAVKFAPASNNLIVTSWDETLRLYDGFQRRILETFRHDAPLLDGCFYSEDLACAGGMDGSVVAWSLGSGNTSGTIVGRHDGGVRCTTVAPLTKALLTGGWDGTLRSWDPRAPVCQNSSTLPGKCYALATSGTRIVAATSGRHVLVYDQRNMSEPEQRRESSLQHQTRCVAASPDGQGYTLGSVEGRVAVEVFDPSPAAQKGKYAFKCHRANVGGVDYVYPINAMAFHPGFGTFATGGCDGFVNVWDGANRKRLCQFHRYPAGIAAMDFNFDGSLLAIAASYTYEEGEKDHPPDAVFVRTVSDADVKPKPRKK